MQGTTPSDCHAIAVRIQRLLDEALDRHAGGAESERVQALVDTLRAELGAVPVADRAATLSALRALNPDAELTVVPQAQGPSVRELELEGELERLQAALADRSATPAAPSAPAGEIERAVVRALIGSRGDVDALLADRALASRVAEVVRALVEFAELLGRAFLGATAEVSMQGRVLGVLDDVVKGRASVDELAGVLEGISRQIGGQLLAFREACEVGVRDLLKQIAPAAIEAEAARASSGVGRRFFFHKECWDLLAQRYETLKASDELFEVYFNGPYRNVLFRQAQGGHGTAASKAP